MRKFIMAMVVLAVTGLSVNGVLTLPSSTAQDAAKKDVAPAAKKPRRRLPPYYAQIGLSRSQRDGIYEIQGKYGEQINALQKQIAELEARRDAEIAAVLKPDQKKELEALIAAARKRAEERRRRKKK